MTFKQAAFRTVGPVAAAVLLAIAAPARAVSVFVDFDGDESADTSWVTTPGTTLSGVVWFAQSAAEVASAGGLGSFDMTIEAQDGLAFPGATEADRLAGFSIDGYWDFLPDVSEPAANRVRVGANVLTNPETGAATVRLFSFSVAVPGAVGLYDLVLGDAPGPGFNTATFSTWDDTIDFRSVEISAVPLPGALWLLLSGGLAVVVASGRRRMD